MARTFDEGSRKRRSNVTVLPAYRVHTYTTHTGKKKKKKGKERKKKVPLPNRNTHSTLTEGTHKKTHIRITHKEREKREKHKN